MVKTFFVCLLSTHPHLITLVRLGSQDPSKFIDAIKYPLVRFHPACKHLLEVLVLLLSLSKLLTHLHIIIIIYFPQNNTKKHTSLSVYFSDFLLFKIFCHHRVEISILLWEALDNSPFFFNGYSHNTWNSPARDQTCISTATQATAVRFLTHCTTMGTPMILFYLSGPKVSLFSWGIWNLYLRSSRHRSGCAMCFPSWVLQSRTIMAFSPGVLIISASPTNASLLTELGPQQQFPSWLLLASEN